MGRRDGIATDCGMSDHPGAIPGVLDYRSLAGVPRATKCGRHFRASAAVPSFASFASAHHGQGCVAREGAGYGR